MNVLLAALLLSLIKCGMKMNPVPTKDHVALLYVVFPRRCHCLFDQQGSSLCFVEKYLYMSVLH